MPKWKQKIKLNLVIRQMGERFDLSEHENSMPQEAKDAIATELEKAPELKRYGKLIRDCNSIAEGNRILSQAYDTADYERIWTAAGIIG